MGDWGASLLLAWGIQATGVMSPGPGVALIMGIAVSEGRRSALLACLGIGCAAILMATATVVGLAAVWSETAVLLTFVRYAGAAYLLWLAWSAFGRAVNPPPPPKAAGVSGRKNVLNGFLMQLINPKAVAFWVAVAAVSGLNTAPPAIIALFLAGAFAVSFVGHGLWAVALSSGPFRSLYRRAQRGIECVLGGFYSVVALKLATAEV